MALLDDLNDLATRARHANARTARALAHTDSGRARITDWQVDVQWEDGGRDRRVAGPSSRVRRPSAGCARRPARSPADWWLWLLAGITWIVVSLIILQFDAASVTTVSVVVGLMLALAAAENFALVAIPGALRWVSAAFGALFVVAEIMCLVNPTDTFGGLADMLGFVFGLVGVWWMIAAFLERPLNPLWWIGLIAGILMTGLAFWTAGQLSIHKPYELLVCAGFWALMQGITHIARAFAIRRLHHEQDMRGAAAAAAAPLDGVQDPMILTIRDRADRAASSLVALQAADDEVGDEVGVLGDRFGVARVGGVEVARERGQREGCGAAVGEQEVEGAQ